MSNLTASDFQFISASEFRVLESKFSEYSNSNDIAYDEFKEILTSNNKINKDILTPFLEKIKKKVRDTQLGSGSESENMKNLFETLIGEEEITINKHNLIKLIDQFDLPIVMNEFFSPLGKKEEISFPEFCTLFKSSSKAVFVDSSKNKDTKNETMTNFPIYVQPKH